MQVIRRDSEIMSFPASQRLFHFQSCVLPFITDISLRIRYADFHRQCQWQSIVITAINQHAKNSIELEERMPIFLHPVQRKSGAKWVSVNSIEIWGTCGLSGQEKDTPCVPYSLCAFLCHLHVLSYHFSICDLQFPESLL